jgi:hypothetical protein
MSALRSVLPLTVLSAKSAHALEAIILIALANNSARQAVKCVR